jgi:beta-phosphoglucomutase-like phosphatase (HAD superfamily)
MSPVEFGPSDVKNPRGTPFAGSVPESYWLTKALLFDFNWVLRDAANARYHRAEYPEAAPVLALKHCFRLLRAFEVRIALTSNLSQDRVVGELVRLNLAEDFDNIRCFEDVTELKPKTELHLLCLDMLGLKPWRAVALETDGAGLQAARDAGLFCVGTPEMGDRADFTLDSLLESPLIQTLERIDRKKRALLSQSAPSRPAF